MNKGYQVMNQALTPFFCTSLISEVVTGKISIQGNYEK